MIDLKRLPILRMLSAAQYEAIMYLIVGGWNTVFGVGLYSLIYRLFGASVHYLVLAIPVNIVAITNAFVCYKLFVFRTEGNWLSEYIRCYLVYGGGSLLGMGLLWFFVCSVALPPDVANFCGTVIVMVFSFFGHKFFSFKKDKRSQL